MYKNLCIQSEENKSYCKEHLAQFVQAFFSDKEPTRILVKLENPIPAGVYNLKEDIQQLILSPHFQGHTIYPLIEPYPGHVYMAIPKEDGTWEEGPYDIIDWGILNQR